MTPEPCMTSVQTRRRSTALLAAAKAVFNGHNNSAAALQSLATKVLVLGLNAATSIVVARALKPAGRGEMSAIIMWPGFFAALFTLGLPSSLTYNLRRQPGRAPETIGAATILALLLGLFTGILGFVFLPMWLTKYSAGDIVYARWMLLATPLGLIPLCGRAALEARGDFFSSNLSLWSAPFLTLIGLFALAVAGHFTPLASGLAYVLAAIPPAGFLVVRVCRTYHVRFANIREPLRNLLHFGLRAWGIDLLNALAISEQVLVVHFLSPADMGTYVVAASLARMLSIFQTSAVIVLFPRIAARSAAEVIELTGFTLRVTTSCAIAGAVAAGAIGPMLLRSIYGASYAEGGVGVFRLLLAEVVLSGATQVLAQAYLALGKPGTVTAIQTLGVGIGLLIMPALIKEFGGPGAPLALLVSSVIRLAVTLLSFRFFLKIAPPHIWPKREDIRLVANRLASLTGATAVVPS
jgi:O-antigen/teichoic acid export membrane protein